MSESDALRFYTRAQAVNEAERRSFVPSRMIERLVVQILGCWSKLLAEVNSSRHHAAGQGTVWAEEKKLAKAVRELAENSRVRWPHDKFATAADTPTTSARRWLTCCSSTR
jgi:hypothetical protein